VPLLISGVGIEPREIETGVSLVDIAPTLAQMAGAPVDPAWRGVSLLAPPPERALFAFQADRPRGRSIAVVEGSRKEILIEEDGALPREGIVDAYDLTRDPSERRNLVRADERWPTDVFGRLARRADCDRRLPSRADTPRRLS
jgi:choline-sulfatase